MAAALARCIGRGAVLAARRVKLGNRSMCGAPPPPPASTVATAEPEWRSEAMRLELLILDRSSALEDRQAWLHEQLIKHKGELGELRCWAMGDIACCIGVLGAAASTTTLVMHFNSQMEKSEQEVEAARQELRQAKEREEKN